MRGSSGWRVSAFPLIFSTRRKKLRSLRVDMAEPSQTNREDIIKINGELRLIHQKLDNHITHMSAKIDTIFKIVWTVSFMVLGLILKAVYSGLIS
jgi:hypothetical protein